MFITTETFEQQNNKHDLTHWHDYIEVIRVLKQSMRCVINGNEHVLSEDDICIINPGQLHRIYCEHACTFQRLIIEPSLFIAEKNTYQKYIEPILTDPAFSHLHLKNGNSLKLGLINLIDGIADLEKNQYSAFELKVIALIYMLMQRLYIYCMNLKNENNSYSHPDILTYRRIVDYIYSNYAEKLTLTSIAEAGNISNSKCCLIFKHYAGHSPIEFANLYRLKISTDLLTNTNENIAVIAASCGFGQQSYYNRLFLREYGITPKTYRALYSKSHNLN